MNRGVLPSFIAGTAAQKSRSTAAINALYGLHLMHRNRGVQTAQFSRLIFSTEIEERYSTFPKTEAFISGTSFKVVWLHLKQAVQYGLD